MDADAVRCRGLVRRFPVGLGLRRVEVLRGLDLAVPRGATFGLVGPNGAGKSTLVRLVAGVDRPSAGGLEVLGGDPRSKSVRARLAYLPEDSPFPPELSARAALALLGALAGLPGADARREGDALLERVGLAAAARKPLRTYSRGMLRRFGLAQAFLARPELVLLDEPTAGLDAPGFGVLDDLLAEARARGATVVVASHVLGDLVRHCDRVALLVAGRVAAEDAPAELLSGENHVTVELEGVDARALADLDRWAADHGGRVVARGPSSASLAALYARHGDADGDAAP